MASIVFGVAGMLLLWGDPSSHGILIRLDAGPSKERRLNWAGGVMLLISSAEPNDGFPDA